MRTVLNINDNWLFLKNVHEAPAFMPQQGEKIKLPHTWNAEDGTDGGNDYFRGTCCYAKRIIKSELPKSDKYFLEINGANSSADVYMNGKRLSHHDGGYSTFRVDITSWLREDNCLIVLVDNSPNDTVYPQTADFTFYGGLYRDVNIICVPDTHFELLEYGTPGIKVTATPSENIYAVKIETRVVNLRADDKILYEIFDSDGQSISEDISLNNEEKLIVNNPHLWHGTKDPYLYKASVSVVRSGEKIDEVSTLFGCRSYKIDPQRGFILNGEEYQLRGVSRHQDRLGLGNAILPEHHIEDMELISEMGANTIRLAHYQHDKFFYDLCDKFGMVSWAEIPYISRHMHGGNENAINQMKELITQCYNHPSIVVWGLSNEITMDGASDPDLIRQHRELNDLVHRMDPIRPTTIACLSMCSIDEEYVHIPDVVSYNHYFGWYGGELDQYGDWFDNFHKKYPDTPIGISEYGYEALNWHNSNPDAGDYSEEYQAKYHEELIKQLFSRKYLWATHVWNMFDFGADARAEGGENGQNHKGLVTFDRKYKKDAFYAYKAWLSKEPFVHICSKRYVDRVENVTKVTVYSNQPEVELIIGRETVGKIKSEDHFFRFEVPNIGETKLIAVAGNIKDECIIKKVDSPNPNYILREQGAVLNWFDITERDGYFSLNDKIGLISDSVKGKKFINGLINNLSKRLGENSNSTDGILGKDMIKMINSFSVLRFTSMLAMFNIHFTKEELLEMNERLNKIEKQ